MPFSKKCLTFAVNCDIMIRHSNGLVAQLGERRVRNAEVEGSIPFGSTIYRCVFLKVTKYAKEAADTPKACVCGFFVSANICTFVRNGVQNEDN